MILMDYAPLSTEEAAVHASQKVLVEADDHSALIVGNPQGILGQELMPQPIHQLNIFFD